MSSRKLEQTPAWLEFEAVLERCGGTDFSLVVQEQVALEALARLRFDAVRGDTQAGKYLVDRWLGQPPLPITARAASMTEEECIEGMRADFLGLRIDGRPLDPQFVEKLVQAMAATDRGDDDADDV